MGLLGFARRRTVAEWLPGSGEVAVAPAWLMADGRCVGTEANAYGARLRLASAPGASLTIWAYAVPGGGSAERSFITGYRIDYESAYGGAEPWTLTEYHAEPYYSEWYETPEAASEGARHNAGQLAVNGSRATGLDVSPTAVSEWFGWDGEPF